MYSRIPYLSGYPYCHNICGVEVTVIKITSHEDWTILGIYRSKKVPVIHYKQWISSYTTDYKTVFDHIYTNIPISHLHVDIQAGVLETYFTDHKAVWASFHAVK